LGLGSPGLEGPVVGKKFLMGKRMGQGLLFEEREFLFLFREFASGYNQKKECDSEA